MMKKWEKELFKSEFNDSEVETERSRGRKIKEGEDEDEMPPAYGR